MREGGTALAISEGPDAGDVGFEAGVHFDETVLVGFDAGFVEAKIVGIWTAAGGDQEMGTGDARRA